MSPSPHYWTLFLPANAPDRWLGRLKVKTRRRAVFIRFRPPPCRSGISALSNTRRFAQCARAGRRPLRVSHHLSPRAEVSVHPRQARKGSRNRIHLFRRQPLGAEESREQNNTGEANS